MKSSIEQLRLQCIAWRLRLDEQRLSLLSQYADLLSSYELANVIGTRDRDAILLDHLGDSLSCFISEDLNQARYIVDVGTGAGLPGVPLAIVSPQLRVTLLEATEKKVRFLNYVRERLGLRNVEVLHARVEDIGSQSAYRETFDIAIARALAALPVVVEYCAPLVCIGGTILAMKGHLTGEELRQGIAASSELGVELREVQQVTYLAPLLHKERRLVVLSKVRATSERFPRRVGQAKKRPLGT